MTRKRFVKLAMSHGWDRNGANFLAKFCFKHNVPYEIGATPLNTYVFRGNETLARCFFWHFEKYNEA